MQARTGDPVAVTPTRSTTPRRGRFLAALALVTGLAAGGVGGWVVRDSSVEEPSGLASAKVTRMLDDRIDAVNAGSVEHLASLYEQEAVLVEQDQKPPAVTRGAQAIADHLTGYSSIGFRIAPRRSPAVQFGPWVAEALDWSTGYGILVYRLGPSGRILYQWVVSGTP